MNIYQKLIEVRKTVPYLQKENPGTQYKYVSSSQVLANVRGKMDELGLLLIPAVIGHNVTGEVVEYMDGNRPKKTSTYFTELEMTMTWVNAEKPDETIVCPWYAQGVDIAGEKGVGKALTYGEKYFLLKSFNIATDKDDPDSFQEKHEEKGDAKKDPPKKSEPPKTDHPFTASDMPAGFALVTMEQAKALQSAVIDKYGDNHAALFTELTGYKKFGAVPANEYEKVLKKIRSDGK
jgi:hypothetical protein